MHAFVLFWHEMKNSVVAEIGLLQSQPLMNILFHFLIIVELVMYCFFGIDRWLSQGVMLQQNSGTLHSACQTQEWQSFIQNFFTVHPVVWAAEVMLWSLIPQYWGSGTGYMWLAVKARTWCLLCKFLNSFWGGKSALIHLGMMLKN